MAYEFEYYSGKDLEYPRKPQKPKLPPNATAADAQLFAHEMVLWESAKDQYEVNRKSYTEEMKQRMAKFQKKLQEDYDLNDAQFSLLWNKAWEDGHSGGLQEVWQEFNELHTFVSDYIVVMEKSYNG